ncbi:MAG: GNAT family N-acetyltransferase [Huintestinicola sp.]|uniref:GNAT family N-acetyltransferase n=1 Tax=Huintestinicola sp. TaxID=2981661 RepID=UPI003F029525
MIIRSEMELAAAKQLATDLNCSPEDFFGSENKVTVPKNNEGRRLFTDEPPLFRAASMGMSAVIAADSAVAPYAKLLAEQRGGAEIFEAAAVSALNRELFTHGCCIGHQSQYYLPITPYRSGARHEGYSLRVFEGSEISELYSCEGFSNALLYRSDGARRDILAVCAVNGRRIMGIAGASNDSPVMAQIGIDVLPEFRGMGVGAALVSACAAELLGAGYIPYYGTWSGNIISQRLAAKCGFFPAWCEMSSVKLPEVRKD